MKRVVETVVMLWLLAIGMLAMAQATAGDPGSDPVDGTLQLTVEIHGLEPAQGTVRCALFADEATFLGRAYRSISLAVPPGRSSVTWTERDLTPGTYAFVLHHDVNDNGVNDRNLFGIPREPYAFSRDARARFGPPGWQRAAFRLTEEEVELQAEVR